MARWFRVYDDLADDPKVQRLPAALFKSLINLWCLASQCGGVLPSVADIAFKLRISAEKAAAMLSGLKNAGLIDEIEGGLAPHNWGGRQFTSDSSAERVKRHRAKREAAGLKSQWTAPKKLRIAVYTRDNFQCVYCESEENLSLDHRTPEIRGGTHDIENLQTTCTSCNGAKRDMTHEEYVSRSGYVTLQKHHKTTDSEQNRTERAADAAPSGAVEPVDEDPKAKLFRIGKTALVSFGIAEKRTGSLIGQWLKTRNDPVGLLAAIQFARDQNVAEPVAYISALLSKGSKNGNGKQSLGDLARELAAKARDQERAAGIFRPDDTLGNG